MSDDDEKAGYRRPPKRTQFKKGQSGNPAGRPKAPRDRRARVRKILDELVAVTENGRTSQRPVFEVAIKQLAKKGALGDLRAIRTMLDLVLEEDATAAPAAYVPTENDAEIVRLFAARLRTLDPEENHDQA
jgi:hypothetical protein